MSWRTTLALVLVSASIGLLLLLMGVIPRYDARLYPSGLAAYLPGETVSFASYIEQNRRRVREVLEQHYFNAEAEPFGPGYSLETVTEMRSPFELRPDADRCAISEQRNSRGFLLLHGLTDSPYLVSELARSLSFLYPCATLRGVLMPGHGTVPGDLLEVSLADWQQVVEFGVASFDDSVDELYLVGYSNGAALAIDYLTAHPDNAMISGLILLSPGLAGAQAGLALAPYLKHVARWVSRGEDRDPAKYDSMPTNAAALFHEITVRLQEEAGSLPPKPVFMVVSGDDTTVDVDYVAEYFCDHVQPGRSRLIWYRSTVTEATPRTDCAGLRIVEVDVGDDRYLSHSHVSISMPAENAHYGIDGAYAVCNTYARDPARLERCRSDDTGTVYGEATLLDEEGLHDGKLLRRASYNPLYRELMLALECFIDNNCDARTKVP